jgi:hypothetical protein
LQSQLDGEWGGGTLETGYKVDQTKILMDKRAVDVKYEGPKTNRMKI